MDGYSSGYNQGYQAGMIIDIGLWMIVGFLITKFLIGKLYFNNTGEQLPKNMIITITIVAGLLRTFMIIF